VEEWLQIREAFPWDSAPRYLLRDRDGIYGQAFTEQIATFRIEQVLSAPRSPRQRAYVERVIGTIRRECLDHVLVFGPDSLHRHLRAFMAYYDQTRTHLALTRTPGCRGAYRTAMTAAPPRFPRLAAYIIATNATLHDPPIGCCTYARPPTMLTGTRAHTLVPLPTAVARHALPISSRRPRLIGADVT
jgi:hypothetical protein